jgi:hypothetical protein
LPANPIAEGVEDTQVAELVVIFPTNVCEYDVLDYFPFADLE